FTVGTTDTRTALAVGAEAGATLAAGAIREDLTDCDLAISVFVELAQDGGSLLDLGFIQNAVVVGVQDAKQAKAHRRTTISIRTAEATGSAFTVSRTPLAFARSVAVGTAFAITRTIAIRTPFAIATAVAFAPFAVRPSGAIGTAESAGLNPGFQLVFADGFV